MPDQISAPQPGEVRVDDRGRYLRVDTVLDDSVVFTVIRQCRPLKRVVSPNRTGSLKVRAFTKLAVVPAHKVPADTGADLPALTIDYTHETVIFDGKPVPYAVSSSGPRIKQNDDGTHLVTVTFSVGELRSLGYGMGHEL